MWVPSNLCLFRQFQGILDLYAKVSHRAFQLGMSEEQLNRTDILRIPVNVTVDSGNVTGIPAIVTDGWCCAI